MRIRTTIVSFCVVTCISLNLSISPVAAQIGWGPGMMMGPVAF
jgi:hypothetical protein